MLNMSILPSVVEVERLRLRGEGFEEMSMALWIAEPKASRIGLCCVLYSWKVAFIFNQSAPRKVIRFWGDALLIALLARCTSGALFNNRQQQREPWFEEAGDLRPGLFAEPGFSCLEFRVTPSTSPANSPTMLSLSRSPSVAQRNLRFPSWGTQCPLKRCDFTIRFSDFASVFTFHLGNTYTSSAPSRLLRCSAFPSQLPPMPL